MTFSKVNTLKTRWTSDIELIKGNFTYYLKISGIELIFLHQYRWFSESWTGPGPIVHSLVHLFCGDWMARCHFSSFRPRRGAWSLFQRGLSRKTPYFGQVPSPHITSYFVLLTAQDCLKWFKEKQFSSAYRIVFPARRRFRPRVVVCLNFSSLPPFLDRPINSFVSEFCVTLQCTALCSELPMFWFGLSAETGPARACPRLVLWDWNGFATCPVSSDAR